MESKSYINIAVRLDTHKRLTLMKISGKARNIDEIIRQLIKAYNKTKMEDK